MKKNKKKQEPVLNLKGHQNNCSNMCESCPKAQQIGINTFCTNENSSKYGKEVIKPNM